MVIQGSEGTMIKATTGELPTESISLTWEPDTDCSQRGYSEEMAGAMFAFAAGWLEPLAIEMMVGCYDRDILTESATQPAQAYHLLRTEAPTDVDASPAYRSALVQPHQELTHQTVMSSLGVMLSQSCGDAAKYETSLRRVWLNASRVRLALAASELSVALTHSTGESAIRIEHRSDGQWIAGPQVQSGAPQPIGIDITNCDDTLRFAIDVFWSPWVAGSGAQAPLLQEAVSRLLARGWKLQPG